MAWLMAASIAASFAGSNGAALVCGGGAVRHALNHTRKHKEMQNEPVASRREYFIMDPTLEPAPRCRQLLSCAQWPSVQSASPPRRPNAPIVALFTTVCLPLCGESAVG